MCYSMLVETDLKRLARDYEAAVDVEAFHALLRRRDQGDRSFKLPRGLDSYFDAHMDLCAVHPVFNLYNEQWPILTHVPSQPPAKFVHDNGDRVGRAINSVVSNGVIVSGGLVRDSVLSPDVRVDSYARVNRAVLLHYVRVGRHAVVENAILDKNVVVEEGAAVGVDKDHDRARGLVVSSGGITVVGKGQVVPRLTA